MTDQPDPIADRAALLGAAYAAYAATVDEAFKAHRGRVTESYGLLDAAEKSAAADWAARVEEIRAGDRAPEPAGVSA
ncbi:MAG TPA: hypothetical protein VM782_18130 [Stellaceae bacterium]|nr:hypothetical protein [Stellaceae bacterium]